MNGFVKKMPALLTTPSIEPKLLIAVSAIFAAVEASPMFPSTKASLSRRRKGGLGEVQRISDDIVTALDERLRDAGADSL